ncbi:MAG TPA: MCE family protein [Mycobacteriales bacterium]|jgi:phospholipid/cholesterol/gamma-HCH transport system substrate-binding protein|nr:MCE family protein [Mycobacteriales bacterium]
MISRLVTRVGRPLSLILAFALVATLAFVAYQVVAGSTTKQLTAYFPRTVGLYKGSAVKVLGVDVGQVTHITPQGTRVRVDLEYDSSRKLPVNVGVALVPPSIVSDRYLQLTPAYTSGPALKDHAVLQEDHTEVPVELDAIFGSLNDLNVALGPTGANKNGALSRLVDVGAANLKGNGAAFNQTLRGFSQAVTALSDSRGALFGTITELQKFTTNLAQNDGGVRKVNKDLADVAGQLAGERQDLGAALANLATALGQVNTFVSSNRSLIKSDVTALKQVTGGLVGEQQALKEAIDLAPLGLHNLSGAFDAQADNGQGLLRTRTNVDPNSIACALIKGLAGPAGAAVNCSTIPGGSSGNPLGGVAPPGAPPIPGGLGGILGGLQGHSLGDVLQGAAR